jgi:hypothetical protein
MEDGAPQFISPKQWQAVKNTVSALTGAEANDQLPDPWWAELRDGLNRLVVSATEPVQPFEVTQHFLWLLQQYIAGSLDAEVSDGSQLVLDWAAGTLDNAERFGLNPVENGTESVWVVMHNV